MKELALIGGGDGSLVFCWTNKNEVCTDEITYHDVYHYLNVNNSYPRNEFHSYKLVFMLGAWRLVYDVTRMNSKRIMYQGDSISYSYDEELDRYTFYAQPKDAIDTSYRIKNLSSIAGLTFYLKNEEKYLEASKVEHKLKNTHRQFKSMTYDSRSVLYIAVKHSDGDEKIIASSNCLKSLEEEVSSKRLKKTDTIIIMEAKPSGVF